MVRLRTMAGTRLLWLFNFMMAVFISLLVISSSCSIACFLFSKLMHYWLILLFFVQSPYSSVPSLAWYRFSNYPAMYCLVSPGPVVCLPSFVIVLYSMLLDSCFPDRVGVNLGQIVYFFQFSFHLFCFRILYCFPGVVFGFPIIEFLFFVFLHMFHFWRLFGMFPCCFLFCPGLFYLIVGCGFCFICSYFSYSCSVIEDLLMVVSTAS